MKKLLYLFSTLIALLGLIPQAHAAASGHIVHNTIASTGQLTFATADYPPPGTFLTPQGIAAVFNGNVVIGNLQLRDFNDAAPLPGPGSSQMYTGTCDATLQVSTDGGVTSNNFACTASTSIQMQYLSDDGVTVAYTGEMLSLDLSEGSLPPNIKLRESPTLQSTGQTTVKASSTGGYTVSSFFDVFTEVSLDGGSTWTPAKSSVHVQLDAPPLPGPDITFASSDFPSDGDMMTPPGGSTNFPNGVEILAFDYHGIQARTGLPALGGSSSFSTTANANLDIALPGLPVSRGVQCDVAIDAQFDHTYADGTIQYFQTEMLSLSVTSSELPAGVAIRESPTEPSRGLERVIDNGDGTFRISSFFDVFTEVSLDGGSTWTPASSPTRMQLDSPPLASPELTLASDGIPPPGNYMSVTGQATGSPHPGWAVGHLHGERSRLAPAAEPRSALGVSATAPLSLVCSLDLTVGGSTQHLSGVSLDADVQYLHAYDDNGVACFHTEMLSLSLSGGNLPGGIMVRESPSKASLGRTTIRANSDGTTFAISSFFDVFTELSLDGGSTWSPADSTIRVQLDAPPMSSREITFASDGLLPPGPMFSPPGVVTTYGNGARHRALAIDPFPDPPNAVSLGSSSTVSVTGTCAIDLALSGASFSGPTKATVSAEIEMDHNFDYSGVQYTDAHMVSFAVSGGSLPPTIKLRESPTLHSTGQTTIRPVSGGYMISSFFDIFTELSVDGGSTWSPSVSTTRLQLDVPAISSEEIVCAAPDSLPRGHYVSKQGLPFAFEAAGASVSNFDLSNLATSSSLQPLGGSIIIHGDALCALDISTGSGPAIHVSSAAVSMDIKAGHDEDCDGVSYYRCEVLQMSVTDDRYLLGLRLRESPTLQSTGQTTVRPASPRGYRISSFFDIFTELSLDGGATWTPASVSMHVQLSSPPMESPEMLFGSASSLPRGHYLSPPGVQITCSDGTTLSDFDLSRMGHSSTTLPALGASSTIDDSGYVSFDMVVNGKVDRKSISIIFHDDAGYVHAQDDTNGTQYYETEMLSLSLSGGSLPGGVMVRESPSKASLGRTSVRSAGGGSGGGAGGLLISSFFDVFLEVSLDGGATWLPASNSCRLQIDTPQVVSTELVESSDDWPPPGVIITPPAEQTAALNGMRVRLMELESRSVASTLPALDGVSVGDLNGDGVLDFALPGASFSGPVPVSFTATVSSTHDCDDGNDRFFDTEMLQLSLSGGGLPPGVMIRESPSKASLGRTAIRESPTKGRLMSSFFDVFTEMSLDGGATWSPATSTMRLELDAPPEQTTEVVCGSSNYPPKAHFLSPPGAQASCPNGVIISNLDLGRWGTNEPLPDGTLSMDVTTTGTASLTISLSGSNENPTESFASVTTTLHVSRPISDPNGRNTYSAEMLQLDISGGTLPGGVMIRESPTLHSTGQTTVRPISNGRYGISSFFDVFTEVSLDGGATWTPASSSIRCQVDTPQVAGTEIASSSSSLPPIGQFAAPRDQATGMASGARMKNFYNWGFSSSAPPPDLDSSNTLVFTGPCSLELALPGAGFSAPTSATATVRVRTTNTCSSGACSYFDTEMLQLDISGGNLPGGVMVRESPSKASLGKTSVRESPTKGHLISSFFDVFTELSLDGGQTWSPSTTPMRLQLETAPQTFGVPVSDRWNLISLPVSVQNNAVSVCLPSISTGIFSFSGSYQQEQTLTNGKGYWAKFSGPQSVSIFGAPIYVDTIAVDSGWNLIGSVSAPVPVSEITSDPPGLELSNFFGYEGRYVVTDTLEPGKGYWVKSGHSGQLVCATTHLAISAKTVRIVMTSEAPPAPPDEASTGMTTPMQYSLSQNYPNPFNPTTNFGFQIMDRGFVVLKVFNILGQEVATLMNETKAPGAYEVSWDAGRLASGVYYYRLDASSISDPANHFVQTKKMMLVR